jgi:dynein heavy chain
LIAGVSDGAYDNGNCPCNDPPGGTQEIRPFMGNNYFCESANPNRYAWSFFFNDALWDGEGCGSMEGPCCAAPGLPWFHRDYGNMSSTDSIELRVCGNQGWEDEDTPISFYEIYIK